MQEMGRVVKVDGNIALVEIERRTACGRCQLCEVGRRGASSIEAYNAARASVGDIVTVEMEGRNVLAAAFIAYMVPLIFMFVGFFVGDAIAPFAGLEANSQTLSAVLGVVFLVGSYGIVHLYDKAISRRGTKPRVVEIINANSGA
ncbi:MAG: SoxR reducing system RseC family protein [Firmicutes bacterium]|nr:SoxR reducing system RseC family protein [Bacillota bacterium]